MPPSMLAPVPNNVPGTPLAGLSSAASSRQPTLTPQNNSTCNTFLIIAKSLPEKCSANV